MCKLPTQELESQLKQIEEARNFQREQQLARNKEAARAVLRSIQFQLASQVSSVTRSR